MEEKTMRKKKKGTVSIRTMVSLLALVLLLGCDHCLAYRPD